MLEDVISQESIHEGRSKAAESAPPDVDAAIRSGATQGVDENIVLPTGTANKTALTNKDSAESNSKSIEDAKADLKVAKEPVGIVESKAKRGPKAKMHFHYAVAEVVRSYGPNWKKHLEQIVRMLDKRKRPSLARWATRNPPARSWERAWRHYPDVVLKALEYSLKMAARDITEKPSETLGNLR